MSKIKPSSHFENLLIRQSMVKDTFLLVMFLLMSACSHDYDLMRMEEQVSGYGAAIRWNLFKKAVAYLDPAPSPSPDWQSLAEIKVTSYTPQFRELLPSGKVMMQSVEIRYLPPGSVVEKSLLDQQRWHLQEGSERWVLETGLPRF